MRLPSSPSTTVATPTRTRRARSGVRIGDRCRSETEIRTRPSATSPSGPWPGEVKAAGLAVWVFWTHRAAWIWSLRTTRQPRPRELALTAARMFAGPSAPAIAGLRMAPVTTTGASVDSSRSRAYATSSMVSVPWVTTAPVQPPSSAPLIAAASSNTSPNESDAPGFRRKSTIRGSASTPAKPGTAASSSGADRAGATPPPGACVIAIVPPSPNTATHGLADSLLARTAFQPDRLVPSGELLGRELLFRRERGRIQLRGPGGDEELEVVRRGLAGVGVNGAHRPVPRCPGPAQGAVGQINPGELAAGGRGGEGGLGQVPGVSAAGQLGQRRLPGREEFGLAGCGEIDHVQARRYHGWRELASPGAHRQQGGGPGVVCAQPPQQLTMERLDERVAGDGQALSRAQIQRVDRQGADDQVALGQAGRRQEALEALAGLAGQRAPGEGVVI